MKEQTHPKCTYCFDKKYYSVAEGGNIVLGDFVRDPKYHVPIRILKYPCKRCNLSGQKETTCECGGIIETHQGNNGFPDSWYCLQCGKDFENNPFKFSPELPNPDAIDVVRLRISPGQEKQNELLEAVARLKVEHDKYCGKLEEKDGWFEIAKRKLGIRLNS